MRVSAILILIPYRIKEQSENELYRLYVTESLRIISENTAKIRGGGEYMTKSFDEIINPKPTDNRTAEEIINDITKKAGIEVVYS